MSSPFSIFRKHQKVLLAVFGVILMVVFTIGYSLSQIADPGVSGEDPVAVTWDDGQLTRNELYAVRDNRAVVQNFLINAQRLALTKGAFPEQRQWLRFGIPLPVQPIISDASLSLEGTVQTLLLAQKARDLGFVVTDSQITAYLKSLADGKLSNQELKQLIEGRGPSRRHTVSSFYDVLRTEMLADRIFQEFRRTGMGAPPAQRLDYYERLNRQVSVEGLAIPVAAFVDQVKDPSEPEVRSYFDRHKTALPPIDSISGTELVSPDPGFKSPHRVSVEYVRANVDAFLDAAREEITEEEIKRYYEENKVIDESLQQEDELQLPEIDESAPTEPEANGTDPAPDDSQDAKDVKAKSDAAVKDQTKDAPPDDADSSTPDTIPVDKNDSSAEPKDDANGGENSEAPKEQAVDTPKESEGALLKFGDATEFTFFDADDSAGAEAGAVDADTDESADVEPGGSGNAATAEAEAKSADPVSDTTDTATDAQDDPKPAADDATDEGSDNPPPPADTADSAEPPATADDGTADDNEPATAQPADNAADSPGTDDAAGPSAAAPAADSRKRELRFKPLDEVRDYIVGRLAEQKAEKMRALQLRKIEAVMKSYETARLKAPEGQEPTQPRPDIKALADEYGLEYGVIERMSQRDFAETAEIGKSYMPKAPTRDDPSDRLPFGRIVFHKGGRSLFAPGPTQDDEGFHYMFWKTEDAEEVVPELDDETRSQVVRSWKLGAGLEDDSDKARGLVRKRAEQLAEQLRGGAGLEQLQQEQPGSEIVDTDMFSWLSTGEFGQPQLSQVDDIDQAGTDFMQAVYGIKPDEVTVAMNHPRDHAYVIRMKSENKSPETLQQNYLDAFQKPEIERQINAARNLDLFSTQLRWLKGIDREFNVEWLKPELRDVD